MGVHLIGVYLMGVYLIGVYLMGVCLVGRVPYGYVLHGACIPWACTSLGVYLISVYLIGVHLLDAQLRLEDALETAEDDTVIATKTILAYYGFNQHCSQRPSPIGNSASESPFPIIHRRRLLKG